MKKCLIALLFALALTLQAQNNRLYTTQQGLATSNLNSLYIDSRGLMWMTGSSELGYFDGARFHYLPNIDPATGTPRFSVTNQIEEAEDGHYWLMTNRGLYYFDSRHLSYEHITLRSDESSPYSVSQMLTTPLYPDERCLITAGYGQYIYNIKTHQVDRKRTDKVQHAIQAGFVTRALVDHRNQLWVCTAEKRIVCVDLHTLRTLPVTISPEAQHLLQSHVVNRMLEVQSRGAIYLTTGNGILRCNPQNRSISLISSTVGKPYSSLLCTHNGQLLVGTDSYGVWQLDGQDQILPYELEDQLFDLSLGKVKDIVEDQDGNLAIALLQKGIFVIPQRSDVFRFHTLSLHGDGKNSSCITSMEIDPQGNYWLCTDGAGVFTTAGTHMATAHAVNQGLRSLLVQSVVLDAQGSPWVGSYGGGVQHWDAASHQFVTPAWLSSFSEMLVMSLAINPATQHIYAGTNGSGVYDIDLKGHTCTKIDSDKHLGDWITCLYVDPDQTLWVQDVGNVSYLNLVTGAQGRIQEGKMPQMMQCVSSMGRGAQKRILIGTPQGLAIHNPMNGEMQWVLQGTPIQSINQTEDQIWVSSNKCIYAIDKRSHHVTTYNSLGGYFTGEFHRDATLDNHVGNLLFGCDNGIVCFTPKAMRHDRKLRNQILFTALRVGEQDITYSDSTRYLDANILDATKIRLPYNENSFTLQFAVPDLCTPQQIHYEYLLKGYDHDWVMCHDQDEQYAHYSSLPAGNYTLIVRAHIEGVTESEITRQITIHVASPWYASWWMRLFYLLLLLAIIWEARRIWLARRQEQKVLNEALHNEEIKEAKLRLFTSITHELRTPLTMIVSPLRQLMSSEQDQQKIASLEVMKHNCDRLLDIVRQITDIRKIDAGQFRLHFAEVDLCAYTRHIAESFMGAATAKHINLQLESNQSAVSVWIDHLHFEKVLVNILSNAFKFCPEEGRILIRIRRLTDTVEMSIFNGGSHIDEQDVEHIFERFYQSSEGRKHMGSGIGLNLAYELVQLHHGTISAHNVEPDGVEFSISLPAGCTHLTAEELESRPEEETPVSASPIENTEKRTTEESISAHVQDIHTEATTTEGSTEEERATRPTLLIVDDSKEMCEYLRSQLKEEYNITLAFSGNSAWNLIVQERPDLIITDMKMPDGDGIELCQRVKSNPEYDHTPIIMLTGEGSESLQLKSLHLRVDHYMQKPFNMEILQGVIRQVLGLRENLKRHMQRHEISSGYEEVEITSLEDKLFDRVNATVKEHLDDDQFSVQELADVVGVNRVQLNRKMKEKYGMSPNVYIRTYRLKQAAYLLVNKRVNVSEVAYRVGFTTHSYFSSCFHEFFGMSPKDFIVYYSDPKNAEKLEKLIS